MTVRIVTDSACDLPQYLVDELGIDIVPLTIRFGKEEFVDRVDLSTEEFWRRCASSPVLPETAAPSPGAFEEAFRTAAASGTGGVVCVSLSSALSATMQSARLAAEAVRETVRVEVVDSRSVTVGLGMIVVAAARAARDGAGVDELVKLVTSMAERTHVWGALDTLDNLKKGGRIGGAKALLASVLSIKPIIEVRNGAVEEGGRQRTRTRAWAFLVDKVRSQPRVENLAVMHANVADIGQLVDQLRPLYPGDIIVGQIGAVIGAHAGPGTVGVIFQTPV
jgi:fatty acid kinase fatty acid binding subunit